MIPERTKQTIDWYVQKKAKPGGFVEACLAYDFIRSIQVADCNNMRALKYIVDYILEFVPDEAKGNYQRVDAWMDGMDK